MIDYEEIVFKEARFYGVEISSKRTRKNNDVRYWKNVKRLQIPNVISTESIFYCFLGIGRYSVQKTKPVYLSTYKLYMWALDRMKYYGIDTSGLIDYTKNRVIYDVASYNNKKGDMDKLHPTIKEFLSNLEPDFTTWKGKYVSITNGRIRKTPHPPIADAVEKRKVAKRARIAKIFNKEKDNE
jgi:hypothetical protein